MKEHIKFSSQMGTLYFGKICRQPVLGEGRRVLFSLLCALMDLKMGFCHCLLMVRSGLDEGDKHRE